uniref:DNA-directed RNA polymerase n=1 Tax=Pandorina colemaniae TaxID=47786 RepID=A0A6C0RV10_9CHLO|nr:alpha subunit of RNA polymerase [Pandorina colemaniae]
MKPKINIKKIMTKIKTTDFFIACKESRIENNTSFYGCFYLGPFDESLSQTLANDLRRTLLSELTGLAITSIEIEGVLHKFSSLPGMKESVLDLICNLQNIVLKKHKNTNNTKKTYTGFLNVNGPRVIKAVDLKLPSGLQCVDPNQYIATLAEDGVLNLKFNINEGKNFIKQKPNNLDVQLLKKRNILLQDASDLLLHGAVIKSQDSSNIKFNLKLSNSIIKNKKKKGLIVKNLNKGFVSNPLPLDAVFMPVTKINCIVEENNMYSDFSTDFQQNNFNLKKVHKSIYIGAENFTNQQQLIEAVVGEDSQKFYDSAKQNLMQKHHDFIKKSVYVDLNVKSNSQIKSDFGSFLNFINYNSRFQTFYFKQKQHNDLKLIPWQSNSLYFSKTKTSGYDLTFLKTRSQLEFDKIKIFLACKANQAIQETLNKDFDTAKIKKKIIKIALVPQQKETVNKTNNINKDSVNKSDFFLFSSSQHEDHAKQNEKSVVQINTANKLIQNNMYFEYFKNLKIKPLRKKTHLIVEIWTNGSIHPRQALYQSFSFLSNVFLKLQTVKMFDSPNKAKIKTNSSGNIMTLPHSRSLPNVGLKMHADVTFLKTRSQQTLQNQLVEQDPNSILYPKIIKLAKLYYLNKQIKLTKPNKNIIKKSKTSLVFPIKASAHINKPNEETFRVIPNKQKSFQQLKTPISILPLSLRTYTALKKENILTLHDLIQMSKNDLLKIKNIGIKSLGEIETSLYCLGLTLKI